MKNKDKIDILLSRDILSKTNKNLTEVLNSLVTNNIITYQGFTNSQYISIFYKNTKLFDNFRFYAIILLNSNNIKENIYILKMGIKSIPICPICNYKVPYGHNEYRKYCSIECVGKSNHIKKIRKKSFQSSLGTSTPFASPKSRLKGQHTRFKNKISSLQNIVELISNIDDYTGVDQLLDWKCIKCFTKFKSNLDDDKIPKCPKCNPSNRSKGENEILEYISSIYIGNILSNTKSAIPPYEIDIYLPDNKLCIEYNGLYWHSNKRLSDNYHHLMKTEMAKDNGLRLIHIFEDEWILNKDIVKSRIKNMLGFSTRLYARKCQIKLLNNKECSTFENENHTQGSIGGSIKIGLFYNDILRAIMTFGKSRFNKQYEYELRRYCSSRGITVVGGASRLLSQFIKQYNPRGIISYADRRWSNGNLYEKLGFDFIRKSSPNYFYFKNGSIIRESRNKYMKHNLSRLLDIFDPNKTEKENMEINNYNIIYDSGNLVYGLILKD